MNDKRMRMNKNNRIIIIIYNNNNNNKPENETNRKLLSEYVFKYYF